MTKKIAKTKEVKKTKEATPAKKKRYYEAVGRRKTAVARVRLFPGQAEKGINAITVNDKPHKKYFPLPKWSDIAASPFEALSLKGNVVSAKVKGGGIAAQAEAIRLGISRALVALNPVWRPRLRAFDYLKRDPRMVERKKPGLRKARRPQQWRKR